MKKYLAFLAAAVLLMSLAGCSGGGAESKPATTTTTTANAAEETQAPEETLGPDETLGSGETVGSQGSAVGTGNKTGSNKTVNQKTNSNKTKTATKAPTKAVAPPTPSQYTIAAKGSPYATGIKLPKLDNPNVVYMTNTTMQFIKEESSDKAPTAIYHAMLIWKAVYGVDVKIDLVDWDSFGSHLTTAVVSGEAPDVMRYTSHPNWIVNNLVKPLDGIFDLKDADYDQTQAANNAFKGKTYAVFAKGTPVLDNVIIYNKSKFDLAGEPTPLKQWQNGKWNWDAFVKSAKHLTNVKGDEYGFNGWGLYPTAFPMISMNKDGSLKLWTEDAKFTSYMTKVYDLYHTEHAARNTESLANYKDDFPGGKDAMILTGAQDYPVIKEAAVRKKNKDVFGIAPAPVFDFIGEKAPRGEKNLTTMGFSMSAAPMNEKAALEFIRLVTKVGTNITKQMGKYGILTDYLTSEEKAMLDKVTSVSHAPDVTYGVGNCELIKNEQCITHMYMGGQADMTLSEILNALTPLLKEEIKSWELQNGIR